MTPAPSASTQFRVLLVEDHIVNEQVIILMLRHLGCEVESARDGETAVERAAGPFDVILMDCGLPRMDGYEAARRIRAQGVRTPIIAVTAYASEADRHRALTSGMDAWLAKPISKGDLERILRETTGWDGSSHSLRLETAVLDRAVVDQLVELAMPDDPGFFERIVESFRSTSARGIEEMERGLREGQFTLSRRHLHQLRSSASAVGAEAVRRECARLESEPDEVLADVGLAVGDLLRTRVTEAVAALLAAGSRTSRP